MLNISSCIFFNYDDEIFVMDPPPQEKGIFVCFKMLLSVEMNKTLSPFEDLSFFLLPNKTEWALVNCPETLCLQSTACCTHPTEELDQ